MPRTLCVSGGTSSVSGRRTNDWIRFVTNRNSILARDSATQARRPEIDIREIIFIPDSQLHSFIF